MSEDTRLRLLLDWVAEFEALDDDGQDKFMRGLAGAAALDASRSAGEFWRALYDLAVVIDNGGSPPPVEDVKAVRAALARVLDSELGAADDGIDLIHNAASLTYLPDAGPGCWRAITALCIAEKHDREALARRARPALDDADGWAGPTAAEPGEAPDVEVVHHWE